MDRLFFGVIALCAGLNIEQFVQGSLAQRPIIQRVAAWRLLGAIAGFALLVGFVASLFLYVWWEAIAAFVVGSLLAAVLARAIRQKAWAPSLSKVLLVLGLLLLAWSLLDPNLEYRQDGV